MPLSDENGAALIAEVERAKKDLERLRREKEAKKRENEAKLSEGKVGGHILRRADTWGECHWWFKAKFAKFSSGYCTGIPRGMFSLRIYCLGATL